MKTLVVEDDFTSRLLLQEILKHYGPSHIALNGTEAVEAVRTAMEAGEPYDLVCLDIMMPEMDGQRRSQAHPRPGGGQRHLVHQGAKIVMTTALHDVKNIVGAFSGMCDAYLIKPIDRTKMLDEMRKLELIE